MRCGVSLAWKKERRKKNFHLELNTRWSKKSLKNRTKFFFLSFKICWKKRTNYLWSEAIFKKSIFIIRYVNWEYVFFRFVSRCILLSLYLIQQKLTYSIVKSFFWWNKMKLKSSYNGYILSLARHICLASLNGSVFLS